MNPNDTLDIAMAKNIKKMAIDKLTPYGRNARTHSKEQIAKIAASIVEFGFVNPILLDTNKGIIAGHGRYAAAQLLGLSEVPVIVLDHLDDKQRRTYIIADNKLAEEAGWDQEMLAAELEDLYNEGVDITVTGFEKTDEIISDLFRNEIAPDDHGDADPEATPATPIKPATRTGEVWILDAHRVMCGDATNQENVDILMAGELADLVITDPPYNVNYEGTAGKIMNDNMHSDDFLNFLIDAFLAAFNCMKEGAPFYICHSDSEGYYFRAAALQAGFKVQSCLIWKKNRMVLGRSDYHWQHEPILYGWKPGAAHSWYGARNKKTILQAAEALPFSEIEKDKWQLQIGDHTIIIEGKNLELSEAMTTIITHDRPQKNDLHPTMKPVGLIEKFILNSSKPLDTILDTFGGAGSTLIAAERNERCARLMELDPKYADVIVKRWQDYTGKEAILSGTGQTFNEVKAERNPEQAETF